MAAVSLAFELIVMISIGIFAVRSGIIGKEFEESLISFMISITIPCMIIQSFDVPFSPEQLRQCGLVLSLSLLMLLFYFVLGQGMYTLTGKGARGRAFRFGTMFTNFTFMGLPVIQSLFGQEGLFLFVLFVIPFRLAYFSLAKPFLTPPELKEKGRGPKAFLQAIFTPPVIAVFIGLGLYFFQLKLPAPVSHILTSVGNVTSPMGMILCGISLGGFQPREFLHLKHFFLPVFRNFALPALTVLLLFFLPVPVLMKKIIVIFAAMPVASLLAAFTAQYDPDPRAKLESGGAVFFSTLLSALSIPLWALWVDMIFQ